MAPLRFDESYRERATLRDGTQVTLRLVQAGDKELLRRGFARLSENSRYRRFLSAKNELTEADLAYFTEVDGYDHFAMGATIVGADGGEEGLGIARFIRSRTDARSADVAIAVVDDWQNKGLGTLMLLRLVAAARERGIERFEGVVLPANTAIRNVLAQLDSGTRVTGDDQELSVAVDLAQVPVDTAVAPRALGSAMAQIFSLVARGLLTARDALVRLDRSIGAGRAREG